MLLTHGLRAAGRYKPPILTYIGSAFRDGAGATITATSTFSNQNIGTASPDRLVVVVIGAQMNAVRSFSSCTIAGVAANVAVSDTNNSSTDTAISAICYLNVTSGTTANIVVTLSGTTNDCFIAVYTITGLSSYTPVATTSYKSQTGTGGNKTLDVNQNGCVVMESSWRSNSTTAIAYTGMSSSDGNVYQQATNGRAHGAASNSKMTANASTTVGASATASSDAWCWTAASWR